MRCALLHCAKMRAGTCHRNFMSRPWPGAKYSACSTSWHCWRAGVDYIFEQLETSLAGCTPRRHTDQWTAVGGPAMALNHVTLDDKYDLAKSRIFVTGFQALVRLCLMQKERDRRAGLNTAGFVTGYRGSPLGTLDQQFIRA